MSDTVGQGNESSVGGSMTGGGSDEEGTEKDSQDEDSSSETEELENDLDYFRYKWHQEIHGLGDNFICNADTINDNIEGFKSPEEQAKDYFLKAVQAEQNGRFYEAISLYKRAFHLDPDIEYQFSGAVSRPTVVSSLSETSDELCPEDTAGIFQEPEEMDDDDDDDDLSDLMARFQRIRNKMQDTKICKAVFEPKMTHISSLPVEVFLYIIKWVVSSDLDTHSLEQLAAVCRGFYVCVHDSSIWRLACLRVWGVNCGLPNRYGSWRNMYLQRPRISFNGVYISKTTYIRYGEASFQDVNYRPCYLVEYFRYLRFFPEGMALMLTTADDPYQTLSKLRQRKPGHPSVLTGHYRLFDNRITAVLSLPASQKIRQSAEKSEEKRFHIELEIRTVKGRKNCQLLWKHYSIHRTNRNGVETASEFDLAPNNFPSFWYSRVRSYSSKSERPLQ